MVHFKRKVINGTAYLYAYQGNKFIRYVGKESKVSPEVLNFIRKTEEEKIKQGVDKDGK